MLRYHHKPPKPPRKPVTKAMAQQRRAENFIRRADIAFAALFGLAAGLIMSSAWAAAPAAGPAPQVGDRLIVNASAAAQGGAAANVPARLLSGPWAMPGEGCWLDETVMRAPGGTLTVLAVRPDGVMLSWVGGSTARIASCPSPAQLLVTRADYAALAEVRPATRPAIMR